MLHDKSHICHPAVGSCGSAAAASLPAIEVHDIRAGDANLRLVERPSLMFWASVHFVSFPGRSKKGPVDRAEFIATQPHDVAPKSCKEIVNENRENARTSGESTDRVGGARIALCVKLEYA